MKNFINTPLQKVKNLSLGDKIELLTFKKDRKIVLIKNNLNTYDVIEDGFEYREFKDIEFNKLEKLLKQLQIIEFPRSHKFFLNIIPNLNKDKQIEFK